MNVIPKPGEYRMENHETATVVHVNERWAIGFRADGEPCAWHPSNGFSHRCSNACFNITGPFHEPPTPPEGFELKPKDYVAKPGDQVWSTSHGCWAECFHAIGMTAEEYDQRNEQCRREAPHYIASPIPKPSKPDPGEGWRLLEEEERIERDDEFGYADIGLWERMRPNFTDEDVGMTLRESRKVHGDNYFIRRRIPKLLPKQETPEPQWTCTGESRDRLTRNEQQDGGMYRYQNGEWRYVIQEQRWTNGTDSEWRPVPVTDGD